MRALLLLACLCVAVSAAGDQQCSNAPALSGSSNYSGVFSQPRASGSALAGLQTRSVSHRDHAVVDGAARGWSRITGWENGQISYLIQPSKGANFGMYLADLGPSADIPNKSPIIERFMLVLEGQIEIDVNGEEIKVPANHFAYLPPASEEYLSQHAVSADGAKLLVIERIFAKAEGMPIFKHGSVEAAPAVAVGPAGTCAERALLPDSDEWDADVLVVDVKPGAAAPAVRAHWNNLGALVLSGEGIFRLGDSWYPVKAGDAVWAAPYLPQWFAALGPEPARLLLYRDRNVDPFFVV